MMAISKENERKLKHYDHKFPHPPNLMDIHLKEIIIIPLPSNEMKKERNEKKRHFERIERVHGMPTMFPLGEIMVRSA